MEKAKEVRPLVERCISIARRALPQLEAADELEPNADRNSEQWRAWRQSDRWQEWSRTIAPVVAARRRALRLLGDKQAVKILFDDIAPRFADRQGGYTRVLRLAKPRLGDAGTRAILELVGKNDRVRARGGPAIVRVRRARSGSRPPPAAAEASTEAAAEQDVIVVYRPPCTTFETRAVTDGFRPAAAILPPRSAGTAASTSPSTCAGCATTWSPGWISFGTSTCRGWR